MADADVLSSPRNNPRVIAVIPTLDDEPSATIASIREQSTEVELVIVVCGTKKLVSSAEKDGFVTTIYLQPEGENAGVRIARALNMALELVDLRNYDYVLRVDADTTLPPNFVRDNVRLDADLVGEAGYAMLIRTQPLLEVTGGRFEEAWAEDTYLAYKLRGAGKKVVLWAVAPEVRRTPGLKKTWDFYYSRGKDMYKLGYEPFHVIGNVKFQWHNVLAVLGYVVAALSRMPRYSFARTIFALQIANVQRDFEDTIRGRKFLSSKKS